MSKGWFAAGCVRMSRKPEAFIQDSSSTAWKTKFAMVTVKAEASRSSTNSNGMLMLARTHKSARQLCSDDPRPGDVHTVLLRPRHYRAGAPIWCLCVRDDALALLTSRRCPADEDNG